MKISSHRNIISNKKAPGIKKSEGKDFSQTFDMTKKEQQRQQLKKMLDRIKTAGNKLKKQKNMPDILDYKKQIRAYLSFVLATNYKIGRYRQLLTRVEIINREVESLTMALLEREKANFDIVAKIDEITGLLLDLYS